MSVLKGLQDLLLKMGGTPVSGDNTDELVRKIAAAYDPSSGGGLPQYADSDAGKVLSLNKIPDPEIPTIDIVTEQTVEVNAQVILESGTYDFSSLSVGDTVNFTVNGETVECEYMDFGEDNQYGFVSEDFSFGTAAIAYNGTIAMFACLGEPGEYTISAVSGKNIVVPGWNDKSLPEYRTSDNGNALVLSIEYSDDDEPVIKPTWRKINNYIQISSASDPTMYIGEIIEAVRNKTIICDFGTGLVQTACYVTINDKTGETNGVAFQHIGFDPSNGHLIYRTLSLNLSGHWGTPVVSEYDLSSLVVNNS